MCVSFYFQPVPVHTSQARLVAPHHTLFSLTGVHCRTVKRLQFLSCHTSVTPVHCLLLQSLADKGKCFSNYNSLKSIPRRWNKRLSDFVLPKNKHVGNITTATLLDTLFFTELVFAFTKCTMQHYSAVTDKSITKSRYTCSIYVIFAHTQKECKDRGVPRNPHSQDVWETEYAKPTISSWLPINQVNDTTHRWHCNCQQAGQDFDLCTTYWRPHPWCYLLFVSVALYLS